MRVCIKIIEGHMLQIKGRQEKALENATELGLNSSFLFNVEQGSIQ